MFFGTQIKKNLTKNIDILFAYQKFSKTPTPKIFNVTFLREHNFFLCENFCPLDIFVLFISFIGGGGEGEGAGSPTQAILGLLRLRGCEVHCFRHRWANVLSVYFRQLSVDAKLIHFFLKFCHIPWCLLFFENMWQFMWNWLTFYLDYAIFSAFNALHVGAYVLHFKDLLFRRALLFTGESSCLNYRNYRMISF